MNLEDLIRAELDDWAQDAPVHHPDFPAIVRRVDARRSRRRRNLGLVTVVCISGTALLIASVPARDPANQVTTGSTPTPTDAQSAIAQSPLAFPVHSTPQITSDMAGLTIGPTYGESFAATDPRPTPVIASDSNSVFGPRVLMLFNSTVSDQGAEVLALSDGRRVVVQPANSSNAQVYGWALPDSQPVALLVRGLSTDEALATAASVTVVDGAYRVDLPDGVQPLDARPPADGRVTRTITTATLDSHEIEISALNEGLVSAAFWPATRTDLTVHDQPAQYNDEIDVLLWQEGAWTWTIHADLPVGTMLEIADSLRSSNEQTPSTLPMNQLPSFTSPPEPGLLPG